MPLWASPLRGFDSCTAGAIERALTASERTQLSVMRDVLRAHPDPAKKAY